MSSLNEKSESETTSNAADSPGCRDPRALDRERLVRLLGRLLARVWIREHRFDDAGDSQPLP
jgi:hypothetical protein